MSSGLVLAIFWNRTTFFSRKARKATLSYSVSQSLASIASIWLAICRKFRSRSSQSMIPNTFLASMATFVAIRAGVSSRGILLHCPGVLFLAVVATKAEVMVEEDVVVPGCDDNDESDASVDLKQLIY